MSQQIPVLVTQKIYYVTGTQDVQGIAGLMQVQQEAISNQLMVMSLIGSIVLAGIAYAGWVFVSGFKDQILEEARKEVRKILYSKQYMENFGSSFKEGGEPDNNIPKG